MAGLTFSASTALTITAGSLGSASAHSSAAVTTGAVAGAVNIVDILLTVNVLSTSTAPSGNKQIVVYGYMSEDGTNYTGNSSTTDNVDGTDKTLTAIGSPSNLILIGTLQLNAGAVAITSHGVFGLKTAFGCIPRKWGIVLYDDEGTALGTTVSASYSEVYYA